MLGVSIAQSFNEPYILDASVIRSILYLYNKIKHMQEGDKNVDFE